jgi:hypothetical protein
VAAFPEYFQELQKQDVFEAASRDGFTAVLGILGKCGHPCTITGFVHE